MKLYHVCFGASGVDLNGDKTFLELETCIIESTSQACADGEAIDRERAIRNFHGPLLQGKTLCMCARPLKEHIKELTRRGKFLLRESNRLARKKVNA